jgi:pimeloyl-ACP methyl ester carboxylesterase
MRPGGATWRLPVVAVVGVLGATGCGLGGDAGVTGAPAGAGDGPGLAALTAVQPVTVAGHRIGTRCAGRRTDPSVLLVSGLDASLTSWDQVQPRLSGTTRICAYDRLGVGQSDPPPGRQTVADLAADLDAVIDALGLSRPVVLVAHDVGGVVAATWAEQHRDDLAGLVLVDATPPGYVRTALDLLPAAGSGAGADLRAGVERTLSPRDNAERFAGRSAFSESLSPLGAVPLVVLTRSVSDYGDLRPRVAAALDSAWTGGQQQWAELSSRGRVRSVDLAGHEIQRDQPDRVVEAVREVVARGP